MHNILLILLVIALGSAMPAQAAGFGKRVKAQVQSQPLPPQQVVAQPVPAQPAVAQPAVARTVVAQPVAAQPAVARPVAAQQAAAAPTPVTPQAPMAHYQAPPTLPNGNPNLIHYWYEYGGARLYWQGLMDPQQVKLLGPAWRDPAQHAQLTDTGYGNGAGKPASRKWRSKKAAPAKKAACANAGCGNKVATCPSSTCAGNAACTCGAAQSTGKAPDNAAKPAAAPKADAGKNVTRTYQPGQLGPGPKPTTYTEVTPKAAAIVSQGAAPAATAPGLSMPAPMSAVSPAPLVPAAQPVSAATQGGIQAATRAQGQMSGQSGSGTTGRISQ